MELYTALMRGSTELAMFLVLIALISDSCAFTAWCRMRLGETAHILSRYCFMPGMAARTCTALFQPHLQMTVVVKLCVLWQWGVEVQWVLPVHRGALTGIDHGADGAANTVPGPWYTTFLPTEGCKLHLYDGRVPYGTQSPMAPSCATTSYAYTDTKRSIDWRKRSCADCFTRCHTCTLKLPV